MNRRGFFTRIAALPMALVALPRAVLGLGTAARSKTVLDVVKRPQVYTEAWVCGGIPLEVDPVVRDELTYWWYNSKTGETTPLPHGISFEEIER